MASHLRPSRFCLSLLLLVGGLGVRASIHMSVLSPGTPQACLEVHFEPQEVVSPSLHIDARALVSRSATLSLSSSSSSSSSSQPAWRPGKPPPLKNPYSTASPSSAMARISLRRGSKGGNAILAPEAPGDVIVCDLSSSPPSANPVPSPNFSSLPISALIVVRGAHVLAREGGVQVGEVVDRQLLRNFQFSSRIQDARPAGASDMDVGDIQHRQQAVQNREQPLLQRYYGDGKLVLSAFGSILPVALSEGEERVVKAGHVLAWAETTGVSFGPAPPPLSASSPSAVAPSSPPTPPSSYLYTLRGPGLVYLRSHSPSTFRKWTSASRTSELMASASPPAVASSSLAPSGEKRERRKEREREGSEEMVADWMGREGLGKRLKWKIRSLLAACLSALLFVAGIQVAQALLMEGPEGLKDVPRNIMLLLRGIQMGVMKLSEGLVDLYRSDLSHRIRAAFSTAAATAVAAATGRGNDTQEQKCTLDAGNVQSLAAEGWEKAGEREGEGLRETREGLW